MPQRELSLSKGFTIDATTGYVTSLDPRSKVKPEVKVLFLKKLVELGDVAEACQAAGFNRRALAPHLRADSKFNEDYKATRKKLKTEPMDSSKRETLKALWMKLNK